MLSTVMRLLNGCGRKRLTTTTIIFFAIGFLTFLLVSEHSGRIISVQTFIAPDLGNISNSAVTNKGHGYAQTPNTIEKNMSEAQFMEKVRRYTEQLPESNEVTVVTAYFNIGSLNKRSSDGPYTPNLYKYWMKSFAYLTNPLHVFCDTKETGDYFHELRAHFPANLTTITLLDKKTLWAFQLEKEIAGVYAQKGYPRHPPNTINPLYSCAMHAKFEVMQRVIQELKFKTKYIAWLDIGLFRAEAKKNQTFNMTVPQNFNTSCIGYSQVHQFNGGLTPEKIIRENKVWVGGASFVGTPEMVYLYCSEYRRAVRKLLDMKIMSTDQQVIYSMYQPSFNFKPRVQLQTYTTNRGDDWFYIGYVMKDAP